MISWWQHLSWSHALLVLAVPFSVLCIASSRPKKAEMLKPPDPATRRGTVESAGKVRR